MSRNRAVAAGDKSEEFHWAKKRCCGGAVIPVSVVSVVTHVAPLKHIEPIGDSGNCRIVFAKP